MDSSNRRAFGIVAAALLAIHSFLPGLTFGQTRLSSDAVIQSNFSSFESVIGTQGGVPTQLAFDPNDPGSLYVSTWMQGVRRYDYSETGTLSGGTQVISPNVNLGQNGTNGSYGIAFHDDPLLGSVMYLSRSMPNTNVTPRGQGLGSIVRVNDRDGDGTWGGAGDLNQTIAENIYVADWTHQINQFAIHRDSLFIGVGSMTSNGGIVNSIGDTTDPGESAHTGAVVFIEDLTRHSTDQTSTNAAWFNIGDDLNNPADVTAFKTDTSAFTSNDAGKLRVFSTGLRNVYGVAVNPAGDVWASNNQGGESPSSNNLPDELFRSSYQDDHEFAKSNDEVGDWKDPANPHPSAQTAQSEGFFQNTVTPHATLGNGTSVTGLDFINARGNDFDGHIVLARHSNDGQDVVLVDPVDGDVQQLLTRQNGRRPTDVLLDPYGNVLVSYSTNEIARINVVGLNGDFDGNGLYECPDVDALVAEIVSGNNTDSFDLDGNGIVDDDDLTEWLAEAGAANNASGNPHLDGDANLDGVVDGSDFNVWNSNKFTATPGWCSGDFSADGFVDGSDFNIWNSNKFTSSDISQVPEPSSIGMLMISLLFAIRFGRQRQ